jgi:hypothetical protein
MSADQKRINLALMNGHSLLPRPNLFDTSGRKIGRHYAGPRWESSDGSKISGTVKERADAPQANAIPRLLLVTKSVGSQGSFEKITSTQRVNRWRRRT